MKKRLFRRILAGVLVSLWAQSACAQTLTLSLVGDCTIGGIDTNGYKTSSFTRYVDKVGAGKEYPFARFAALFAADDMTLANCEGVFTSRKASSKQKTNLRATKDWAEAFLLGNVEVVNTANNHTFDYGKGGHQDTLDALNAFGIAHFGGGELNVFEAKGVKIGMTGYSYPHRFDLTRQEKDIATLRQMGCDLVVVSMHWGREGKHTPTDEQRELGPRLIDAGADVVFGHGPHVLQPMELYQGKPIFYSLGNFAFGANRAPSDPDTVVIQLMYDVSDEKIQLTQLAALPARVHNDRNFQPYPLTQEADLTRVYGKLAFKDLSQSRLPERFLSTGRVLFDEQ